MFGKEVFDLISFFNPCLTLWRKTNSKQFDFEFILNHVYIVLLFTFTEKCMKNTLVLFVLGVVQYEVFNEQLSYSDAQSYCVNQNSLNLASFVSQDSLGNMISYIRSQNSPSSYYWTGLKHTKSSNTWSFMDGADTTFAVSQVTLPSGAQNDQCVLISGTGELSVTHCTEGRGIVCQSGQHPPIATSTG